MERLINIFYPSFNSEDPLIFTQLDFWLFFLAVMVVFSFIHKHFLARSIFVTIVSLFFYFKTSGLYVLLLGLSLVVNFALGQMIYTREKKLSKKWVIAISAIFNLLILGYFKYAYFFTDSFNVMFETDYEIVNKFALWGNGFFNEDVFELKIFLISVFFDKM